ncbi:MAG: Hsp20/alpha crystallin family protein [Betaproteobacteria bacterium]|nr:Hsp20/alpha crystallin family protein [Betaproteobacteria bacterium]
MLYRTLFPRDVFAELDRLQRDLAQAVEFSPSIRGAARGGFPGINVGNTQKSVEVYVFVPGVEPGNLDVQLEKGVLTIAGERKGPLSVSDIEKVTAHINERFSGRFRRVIALPDDINPDAVEARYRDGVLHISISRREAALPRRITIQ